MEYRVEHDTMGEVKVPAEKYWGAQTQRSRDNFKIGGEKNQMPMEIIRAFAILKKSAAETNMDLGVLPKEKSDLIGKVCDEILAGKLDDQFPLVRPDGTVRNCPFGMIMRVVPEECSLPGFDSRDQVR